MRLKSPLTAIALTMVVAIAAVSIALYVKHNSAPRFDFNPIQKNSSSLSQPDVESVVSKQFKTVRRLHQVPRAIKQSFANVEGVPFDMANPDELMSTDGMIPGAPMRRLVFAGLADNAAVLVFDYGGFSTARVVMVFSFVGQGGVWEATLHRDILNIDGLRTAIRRGRFEIQKLPAS
jgi:hypothetical protein